jgi:hypothetical protein
MSTEEFDSSSTTPSPARSRRERSTRYPGVGLADCIELIRHVEAKGLDGLSAEDYAVSLGFKNIKTNSFSARLSAARQFGFLLLKNEGYRLTPLAKAILHPIDPGEIGKQYRQALREPPIYAELIEQFDGKRVPDLEILANVLYHHHEITVAAKEVAAGSFLDSARFAGVLGDDMILRYAATTAAPNSSAPAAVEPPAAAPPASEPANFARGRVEASEPRSGVRIDLRLWGPDEGKLVRVRAPETISRESFERLIRALELHLRIE